MTGRITNFWCNKCNCAQSKFVWDKDLGSVPCDKCGGNLSRLSPTKAAPRDGYYENPILSDSAGCHPSQVAQHRKMYPDIPITDDGRVIFKNHYERKRHLKQMGLHDRDSYV